MPKTIGQIYHYDRKTRGGVIVARDMQQYKFSAKDNLSNSELSEGNIVEFEADGQNAHQVRLLTGSSLAL